MGGGGVPASGRGGDGGAGSEETGGSGGDGAFNALPVSGIGESISLARSSIFFNG